MVSTADNDSLLADLFKHPGWAELDRRLKARKAKRTEALARDIVHQLQPIDQRLVDQERGFWEGAAWFLRETKQAATAFERDIEDGEQA